MLFNSRLRLFLGKLRSWWSGPFMVRRVTPHIAFEVWSEPTGSFTVIRQRLKHYTTGDAVDQGMSLVFKEPP